MYLGGTKRHWYEKTGYPKTRMKVVTWWLIKGDTQTTPLLGYGKDLGMILVSNAISKEVKQLQDTSHFKIFLEEYKDTKKELGS